MQISADAQSFDECMREIDRELTAFGYAIPERPISALGVVSVRFRISMPLTKPMLRPRNSLYIDRLERRTGVTKYGKSLNQ